MPEWLELVPIGHSAYSAGTEPGEVVKPDWLKRMVAA